MITPTLMHPVSPKHKIINISLYPTKVVVITVILS